MPLIDEENKTINFSIGDSLKDMKYADISIPFDAYNEMEEDGLRDWLNTIAKSCPLYIDTGSDYLDIAIDNAVDAMEEKNIDNPIDNPNGYMTVEDAKKLVDEAVEQMKQNLNS